MQFIILQNTKRGMNIWLKGKLKIEQIKQPKTELMPKNKTKEDLKAAGLSPRKTLQGIKQKLLFLNSLC